MSANLPIIHRIDHKTAYFAGNEDKIRETK
jgi:hypothetical protein